MQMQIVAAKCPQCGAGLNFNCESNNGFSVDCFYCSTPFFINQNITQTQPQTPNQQHNSSEANPQIVTDVINALFNKSNGVGSNNTQPVFLGSAKNKGFALILCVFFGFWGFHKFYEGKFTLGIMYMFTLGFFIIGWIIDIIVLLSKPNVYYIK